MPQPTESVVSNSAAVLRKDGNVAVVTEYLSLSTNIFLVVDEARQAYGVETGGRLVMLIEDANEESLEFLRGVESVAVYETQSSGKGFICHFNVPVRPAALAVSQAG